MPALSDDLIACHIGTRVRKNHTSRRDAFESVDTEPVSIINGENVIVQDRLDSERRDSKNTKSQH